MHSLQHFLLFLSLCDRAVSFPRLFQEPLFQQNDVLVKTSPSAPLAETPQRPQQIAIIGSGITGAAAAYNIYEQFRLKREPQPELTVFERFPILGGRFTQAFALNSPVFPVDTCAATFSVNDMCIATSAQSVGLALQVFTSPQAGTGVWDGREFIGFVEEDDFRFPQGWSYFRRLKWFARYGNAPQQLAQAVVRARQQFNQFLSPMPGSRALTNLSQAVEQSQVGDLVRHGLCVGEGGSVVFECLEDKKLLFLQEVANAGLRERYFEDIDQVNAIETLLGFEDEMPQIITGGNVRLVERLLLLSRAAIRLNSEVRSLKQGPQGDGWQLGFCTRNIRADTQSAECPNSPPQQMDFDKVILATSLTLANLTVDPPLPKRSAFTQLYDDSCVTHFTTASTLNGTFFGLGDDGKSGTPQNVLTTSANGTASEPPFLALTLIRQLTDPMISKQRQNLYKLVSRKVVTDTQLAAYLEKSSDPTEPLITWVDRACFPKSVPRLPEEEIELLEEFEIAPGMFYAGGGEQVAATAEVACRFGLNAAKLVASDARQ